MDPIHFIPKSRRATILSSRITHIIAAPHHQEAATNHWCFYLATSPRTSIQLDCQPSHSIPSTVLPGGSKAYLILSELDHSIAPDVEGTYLLKLVPGREFIVSDILKLLVENGRHKYEFDFQEVGCRFWVTQQVDLFHAHGILSDGCQVEAVKNAVETLWPDRTELELDQGAYYQ
ncbi:hypothetical protein BJX66DRAFT_345215 [Aspergillus keveii]|uniref:DUF7770 domain-containing protein n=1 Tax=Aspergillus keveii TaxID=714993 RepID=A0ABR4FIQ3_9EURO